MKKFMVLYMAPTAEFQKAMAQMTPETIKAEMDDWGKWMEANKSAIVDGGNPLGKTTRVDAKGVSKTKNEVGGYSVVQADSAEAAAKLFGRDQPHMRIPGAWVEIMEIVQI